MMIKEIADVFANTRRWVVAQGDARSVLGQLPTESVDCVVTSPPYWGLRDYGLPPVVWGGDPECDHEWTADSSCQQCGAWRGQLGLEPDPKEYITHLVEVFRDVRRVLKPQGTLWVN